MRPDPAIIKFLGGRKVLGELKSQDDLEARIRTGLPNGVILMIESILEVRPDQSVVLLGISPRSRSRKVKQPRGKLDVATSDRLLRTSKVFAEIVAVFDGDESKARHWLHSPVYALGQRKPIDLLGTEVGVDRVRNTLMQMRYGVYA